MITTILLAAVLSCPVTVPPGEVTAVVYYEHEAEQVPGSCERESVQTHWVVVYGEWFPTVTLPEPCTKADGAGHLWTVETISVGPGEADIQVQGFPAAVEWWQNGRMLKRCGTRPSRIMWNGFESGTTDRWSRTAQ